MINDLEAYASAGRAAAIARNQRDEARAMFEADYFGRMRRMERPEDRAAATRAYEEAYRAARRIG